MNEMQIAAGKYRVKDTASILLVFVNGSFMPALSDLTALPSDAIFCNAEEFFFHLPDYTELTLPLHFLFLSDERAEQIKNKLHFIFGAHSKAMLLKEYIALGDKTYSLNETMTIILQQAAQLTYYKIQNENDKASHHATTSIQQMENSSMRHTHFSCGAVLARDELTVQLKEQGASCNAAGFYHLRQDQQQLDHCIEMHHVAAHTNSDMLYKGIIDKKSKASFKGKVHVEKDAQHILAYQANHHLLLSNQAEASSKPELEIYADEVKCKHGATTGQIDEEALFYLCTRGIDRIDAVQILLRGFAEEMMARISDPHIRQHIVGSLYE